MSSSGNRPVDSPVHRTVWRDWQWYAVLLAALLVRGGVGYAQVDQLATDPDSYRLLAENIVRLHSFTLEDRAEPTAFRPPLYPLLLAVTSISKQILPWEVFWLHLTLGVLTVGLTFYWAMQVGLGKWRSLAGLLVAVDPILLNQSTLVMTETLATALAILTLVAVGALVLGARSVEGLSSRDITIRAVNIAGAAALAIYCRPTFLIWGALLPLALLAAFPRWRQRGAALLAYGLMMAFLLSPWVARNWYVFGAPVIGTTHGGYTLLWGNNDEYYQYLRTGTEPVWDSAKFHARFARQHPHEGTSASELARDKAAAAEAWDTIRQNPGMAAYSSLVRLTMFWRPMPHAVSAEESTLRTTARYLVGAWYVVQFTLVLLGLYHLRRELRNPSWWAALALVLSFTLVHLLYWSNIRMRAPLVPILAVLACAGVELLSNRHVRFSSHEPR